MPAEIWTDDALAAAARLVRRYHDAVRSFDPPPGATWRVCPGAPARGEIVCHNDIAPWNAVYRDGRPASLIDWDFAAPAPALWDVAYACWRFVPLYYDGLPGASGAPDPREQARRVRIFCDEYGVSDRSGLLVVVEARQQVMHDTVRVWGEAGTPGFAEMWRGGHAEPPLRDKAYVARHRRVLAAG